MQISKTDKVVFFRDVESNIIQEAFVILKDNVKFEIDDKKSKSTKIKSDVCILKEAEEIINSEINSSNLKYDKFKISKLEKKLKILKVFNIFCVIAVVTILILK